MHQNRTAASTTHTEKYGLTGLIGARHGIEVSRRIAAVSDGNCSCIALPSAIHGGRKKQFCNALV
jgi:hypothetical protein